MQSKTALMLDESSEPRRSTRVAIAGTGHALPEEVISNQFLGECSGVSNEWIVSRTGIHERRRARAGESAMTLGAEAALKALAKAGLDPRDVDLIICTTVSPDLPMPSTACLIQARIGADNAACFDISAACSGFLYGMEVAEKMVRSGMYHNALVISVDLMTRWVDYSDVQTSPLFGDGAGAVVLSEGRNGDGILATKIYSNGSLANLVYIGTENFMQTESESAARQKLRMDGRRTFKAAVEAMTLAASHLLDALGICISEIDLLVPHQGNERISKAVAENLGMPL
jgi:3-oxoacyl-[acyl-carrier-protein] synthase-3